MKKILSAFVILSILSQMLPVGIFAKTDTAVADLGEESNFDNIAAVTMENNAAVTVGEKGKNKGWTLSGNEKALYIDFDNDFLSELDDGTEVVIDVEYFDQDNGHFILLYDGLDSERVLSDLVIVENTNQWKTHSFIIDDAYFGGRLDGHDIKISNKEKETGNMASSDVVIGKITVHKYPSKNPVRTIITTDEPGNVFGNGDELNVKVKYHNFSEDKKITNIKLEAVKSNGDVLWSKSEKIEIEGKTDVEKIYKMELSEYTVCDFKVTVTGENIHSETARTFSYINTDTEGIVNDDFQYNVHYGWMSYQDELPEILQKGNVGGIRDMLQWSVYETQKGTLNIDNFRATRNYLDPILIHQDNILILGWGNIHHNWNGQFIPQFEENDVRLDAWYEYCYNLAKDLKGKVNKFEVWNEPVLPTFSGGRYNGDLENADDYVKLLEVAYNAVKAANPDAKVAGVAQAGPADNTCFNWFAEVLRLGGWKYMDAYSLHPYTGGSSFDVHGSMTDGVFKNLNEFEKYGVKKEDIEFWFTEVGYSLPDINHNEVMMGNNIAKDYIYVRAMDICDEYTAYDAVQDGIIPYNREHKFGSINNHLYSLNKVNLSATKAYPIITQMNNMLGDAEPDRIVKYNEDVDVYLYKSNKFNKDVAIWWSKSESKQVNLDLGTDEVTVYDNYGASTIVTGVDGKFTFPAHDGCYYIVGDFKKCVPVGSQLVEIEDIDLEGAMGDVVYINYKNNTDKEIVPEFGKIASNIEVVEKGDRIAVKLPNVPEESSILRINFISEGEVIQSTDIRLNYEERIGTSIVNELYDGENLDKWVGNVTVENYSSNYNINGYIKFNKPESFASLGKIPTGPIPAGKNAKIKVLFPDIKKKGMTFIDYDVVLNDGSKYNVQEIKDFTVAVKTEIPPEINGVMEKGEWDTSATMYSENPEQVRLIKGYGGIEDLSAKTNISWDNENMYMAVKVTDNVFFQDKFNSEIWMGDSIQFGVVVAPDIEFVAIGQRNVTFSELGMALTKDGPVVWRWSAEDSKTHNAGEIKNAECAITREANITTYELKIPWSEIIPGGKTNIDSSRPLGFSMLVNDNDGTGRRGWIEYASGIGQSKNSTLFTYLKLVD